MNTTGRNIQVGLALGVVMATGFSAWVTIVRLLVGTGPFELARIPYWSTVLLYYAGFSIGGMIVGLLLPLRRWALGSALLGVLFVSPVYATFQFTYSAVTDVRATSWTLPALLLISTVVGGGLGLSVWWTEERRPHTNRRRSG